MSSPKAIFRRPQVLDDIEHYSLYIANHDVSIAYKFLEQVERTIADIGNFPSSGAPFQASDPELANLRTKAVLGFPNYIVFYIERSETVELIRVMSKGLDFDFELES